MQWFNRLVQIFKRCIISRTVPADLQSMIDLPFSREGKADFKINIPKEFQLSSKLFRFGSELRIQLP